MTIMQQPASTPTPSAIDLAYRVARNVRAEVARNGDTQAQIADILGCNQQAVSARMRGKTPLTLRDIDALARHWGMRPTDLIDGRPAPDPDDTTVIPRKSPWIYGPRGTLTTCAPLPHLRPIAA